MHAFTCIGSDVEGFAEAAEAFFDAHLVEVKNVARSINIISRNLYSETSFSSLTTIAKQKAKSS